MAGIRTCSALRLSSAGLKSPSSIARCSTPAWPVARCPFAIKSWNCCATASPKRCSWTSITARWPMTTGCRPGCWRWSWRPRPTWRPSGCASKPKRPTAPITNECAWRSTPGPCWAPLSGTSRPICCPGTSDLPGRFPILPINRWRSCLPRPRARKSIPMI
ncbi:hypothetical protein D3C80_1281330 [compost metagenome]